MSPDKLMVGDQCVERYGEGRPSRPQLGQVVMRQHSQQLFSARGQAHKYLTPVGFAAGPPDELDGAVVLDLQPLGQVADGCLLSLGQGIKGEQKGRSIERPYHLRSG